jgi:heme-degrading monooxygenase HmoA
MPELLELSRFRVNEESEDEFLASYPACARALEDLEGFRGVNLAKLDDGSYVFVGTWAKREHCEAAMEEATNVDAISAFLAHISEDISMEYGDVIDVDRSVAAAA